MNICHLDVDIQGAAFVMPSDVCSQQCLDPRTGLINLQAIYHVHFGRLHPFHIQI